MGIGKVIRTIRRHASILAHPSFCSNIGPVTTGVSRVIVISTVLPRLSLGVVSHCLITYRALRVRPVVILGGVSLLSSRNVRFIGRRVSVCHGVNCHMLVISDRARSKLGPLRRTLAKHVDVFTKRSNINGSDLLGTLLKLRGRVLAGSISSGSKLNRRAAATTQLCRFPRNNSIVSSPNIHRFNL